MNTIPYPNQNQKGILDLIQSQIPAKTEEVYDAVPLPGTQEKGYSAICRNKKSVNGLTSVAHPSVRTVKDVFSTTASLYPDLPCLGRKKRAADGSLLPYLWESYGEVHKASDFGAGVFLVLSSNPFLTDFECHRKIAQQRRTVENNEISFGLTLHSHNSREWSIKDLACAEYSTTNTVLYDTLAPDSTKYIF